MPEIPKGLLRLCRLGRKRGRDSTANPASSQKASHESEVTKDLRVTASSDAACAAADDPSTSGSAVGMAFPCVRRPLACLERHQSDLKLALILLNQPMVALRQQLKVLWSRSVLKAVADGGSNRLYECMMGNHQSYIPDLITGDFDSIRPEILLYYKRRGAKIIQTPDQDYTDFTKCLRLVLDTIQCNKLSVDTIVVLGAFGQRFDQTLANVNTLYEANVNTKIPVYLLADRSLGCLLRPGKHVIEVNTGLEDSWCGLVPIGNKCRQVTTTGLKWNLDHQPMQFGGLISTSNTYAEGAEKVTVQTDQPLFWTMGFKDDDQSSSESKTPDSI
ncbi:thiamin pyrophosphokinase 1-like [Patiria miniata]|uniref:Thiamine pyrophosphokinase 1 n=1 Tax=Patiria miniata TaxID=46514 RepID=A0A914A489_PATMI|nr:thiamin pyrophosphokinase 1-like [Patiria miniata]